MVNCEAFSKLDLWIGKVLKIAMTISESSARRLLFVSITCSAFISRKHQTSDARTNLKNELLKQCGIIRQNSDKTVSGIKRDGWKSCCFVRWCATCTVKWWRKMNIFWWFEDCCVLSSHSPSRCIFGGKAILFISRLDTIYTVTTKEGDTKKKNFRGRQSGDSNGNAQPQRSH